ncbi:MAG: YCF48-related protein [Opitutaceae bacterium]
MSASRFLFAALALLSLSASSMAQNPAVARTLLLDIARVGSEIVAVGERGATLHSSDNGQTWSHIPSSTAATLTGVSFAPASHKGWAVGHQSTIISTTDGGRSWKSCYDSKNKDLIFLDVLALKPDHVIAVGAFGLATASRDGGLTWNQFNPTDDDQHLNRISMSEDGMLYIAGERGLLLRSADSGASWEKIPSPYEGSFYGVLPLEDGALMAYGLRGHIFRSESAASIDWKGISTDSPALLATAFRMKNRTIVVAGQARCFLVSRDGGHSFKPWAPGIVSAVAELLQTENGTLIAVGETGISLLPLP